MRNKPDRPPARPVEPALGLVLEPQPDDVTCGPACLHGVYRYYGDQISLPEVTADINMLDAGGTLDVFLANHALRRGYRVTLYSYNLKLFDPTWFGLERDEIREKLRAQSASKNDVMLHIASEAYDEFLANGGMLRFADLQPSLLRRILRRDRPLITGLSATYLYGAIRERPDSNVDDDIRGEPVGHFVVLTQYQRATREILVADPYRTNPFASSRYYAVRLHRLIGAILLGTLTYDANLLLVEPKKRPSPA